ncbi:hypothetical protein SDD30_15330 [Moorella naiadis]|uniref:hypothetical protein n=1 Tax=Moorella naiadis (nom. illeg.) TaxID=3093670 RepID=UPI003D9C9E7A
MAKESSKEDSQEDQQNYIAVPMGLEICLQTPDPEIYTTIRKPQKEKISKFASYVEETAGAEGLYWADRVVKASEYLRDFAIPYLMVAGLLQAPVDGNTFKLEYFRPLDVNKAIQKGDLYIWPSLTIMQGEPEEEVEFELEEDAADVFADCLEIPREAIKLLVPVIMERRVIPFWQTDVYRDNMERSLWMEGKAEIMSILPDEYFINSSYPQYLPIPPPIIEFKLPSKIVHVPNNLDPSIYRKLENCGWVIIKEKDPGVKKERGNRHAENRP